MSRASSLPALASVCSGVTNVGYRPTARQPTDLTTFPSHRLEDGVGLFDPRPAAAVFDIGIRALAVGDIAAAAASKNAGLILILPAFIRALLRTPGPGAAHSAAVAGPDGDIDEQRGMETGFWWKGGRPHRAALVFDIAMKEAGDEGE
mmetsp:Transcript_42978/g.115807  ORF Transcript_42978/g.115807 Transcript_42978/m.115807 type:complete len:148 (+) Transcript_42978:386-829(+)